ncbi:MAG: bifunctional 2',3'-cyclic-nucleotide 2'-phosphodiesterase/3'-nucleotidase [Paracoccaceae bacterium]
MNRQRQVKLPPHLAIIDDTQNGTVRRPGIATRPTGSDGAQPGATALPKPSAEVALRILATTDIHANILSYDYAANRPLFGQGLAQTASLIAQQRASAPQALLFDNGDFLQGTALADLAARQRSKRCHPVIAAMNALGYDAAALGNHEFNFGLEVLQSAIAGARFPILSANIVQKRGATPFDDQPFVPPFAVLERHLPDRNGQQHLIRIGVLGLTPPEILIWDRELLENRLQARGMVETAAVWVPHLRQLGADIVVCLAHTGISETPARPGRDHLHSEGLAPDIAAIDGVDALVAGHSHMVFPYRGVHPDPAVNPNAGTLAGKPAVQPGHSGSHLGVIDLTLHQLHGKWVVAGSQSQSISVSQEVAGLSVSAVRKQAATLRQAIAPDHRATLSWARRTLGQCDAPLTTYFAHVADVRAMHLFGAAKLDYARRLLAGTPHADLPMVATATPYRVGGRGGALNYTDIPAGGFSVRHLFDLYPFPNTLVAIRVTGAALAEQIERAAALFQQITPGVQNQTLLGPAYPGFAYASFVGACYQIDPTQEARYDGHGLLIRPHSRRVHDLRVAGRLVRPTDRLLLVTNNFRTGGTLGIDPPLPEDVLIKQQDLGTDALRDYLQRRRHITALPTYPDQRWRFRALPGTSILLETGPGALQHLDEVAALRPDFLGLTAQGFHQFRLHL